ncbi:3-keto-disaccharide hydrolase [Adhaeretor mobilis]|uniref:3-keto-alpha-glucoside-1,2-lyase/3-keto-2-hydroxy-glucal hydratase domain-containing protein n=1 Tax=Adhaeretor mobilis TaxID=1930276 RepID=A0A517MRE8_9BACT|nr:DUF1080 domain-containing protein [Adhaeretor mobilis]QDS97445.1 hypothetical protein HG15A2_07060 [Adhaeretor mobilis]
MCTPYIAPLLASLVFFAPLSLIQAKEYLPGIEWEEPEVVTPGKTDDQPPSDAIVLFDGTNLDAWKNGGNWQIEDGTAVATKGYIKTKQKFGDCQLHIEWSAPTDSGNRTGQQRGNSGVFFGPYELQVLDSYQHKTYNDGQAGAIYKQTPPWVNAMRPPGEWNVYEVVWTAPRFDANGSLKSPAYITVLHNGVLLQNHFELQGDTPYDRPPEYKPHGKLPIQLQDHGNPVRFRNIWVREISPPVGKRAHPPSLKDGDKVVPIEEKKVAKRKWLSWPKQDRKQSSKLQKVVYPNVGVVERVPRWERWKIAFEVESEEELAECMEQHKITLAVLGRDKRVHTATQLTTSNPKAVSRTVKEFNTFGRTIPDDPKVAELIKNLATQAGIADRGKYILLFFPYEVEEKLWLLENQANQEGDVNKIRQTRFLLSKNNGNYEFEVIEVSHF